VGGNLVFHGDINLGEQRVGGVAAVVLGHRVVLVGAGGPPGIALLAEGGMWLVSLLISPNLRRPRKNRAAFSYAAALSRAAMRFSCQSIKSDSSQPTARPPSDKLIGLGNLPSLTNS
jgi:hypothetical protein